MYAMLKHFLSFFLKTSVCVQQSLMPGKLYLLKVFNNAAGLCHLQNSWPI